jgi:4-alpha-glucanotransferase
MLGIELSYTDTWGQVHYASEDGIRRILSALGVPVDTEAATLHYLENRAARYWNESIDSVIVVCQGAEAIPIRVPAARSGISVKLELEWEGGDLQHHWHWLPELRDLRKEHLAGANYLEKRLPLPSGLRLGYHKLRLYEMDETQLRIAAEARFVVCPRKAPEVEGRLAGLAVSLYGLRSARNWGCGDFTDLEFAAREFAKAGVEFLALNPLHAIANRQPYNTSPYLPQSSMFRNFLYLDVERVPGFEDRADFQEEARMLRQAEFVEYERVAALKLRALAAAFDHFTAQGGDAAFDSFCREQGEELHSYAVYCALDEEMHRRDNEVWVWTQWPVEFQDPKTPAVADFAKQSARRVGLFKFLQWQVDVQLGRAHLAAKSAGMRIGLYHDLALATDRFGADLWSSPRFYIANAGVGAPPDELGPGGQDWAFPPPDKEAHRQDGYERFAQSIRRNARHGGALRIDHVMRFFRLFWIPQGLTPAEGVYVKDSVEDLLGILTLESVRGGFHVIGEDLGTVAEEVRQRLSEAGILGYRLLWFERAKDGGFIAPQWYPARAAVSTTTHDLPTLAGFFSLRDVDARRDSGLVDQEGYRAQRRAREADIDRLNDALKAGGFPGDGLGFILSTPCTLAIVNQEDLTGEELQQNLPASTWQYPNWRRKMTVAVEDLAPLVERLKAAIFKAER